MSSIINKIKEKTTGSSNSSSKQENEPSYSIQPHPARTNDPKDLEGPQLGYGLNSNPEIGALHAHGPYVPDQQTANNLGQPLSREELRARSAQLNQ